VPSDLSFRVAVVSRDPALRLEAARAFDRAPATWSVSLHESPPSDADVVVFAPDVDGAGGIRFDPQQPESILDEIDRTTTSNSVPTTVVTSASGGSGATSVALHLSACRNGVETCFVDLDVSFGAAHRLGLFEPHLTWRDAGESTDSLVLAAVPLPGGYRALLSPGDGSGPEDPGALLDRAAQAFGRLVVDVPDGSLLSPALDRSHTAVLLMRPDLVSAYRTKALLERFPEVRWAVVANRMGAGGETTIGSLEKLIGHPIAIELPCAPALRDAADDCKLLTSRLWRYTRAISRLQVALETA
jgi:hypothetical protein